MSTISCNVTKLMEIKNKFQYLSDDLDNEIKKMNEEIVNLDQILSTPKGNELIELFNEFIEEEKDILTKNNEIITNNFTFAINEYNSFLEETRKQ